MHTKLRAVRVLLAFAWLWALEVRAQTPTPPASPDGSGGVLRGGRVALVWEAPSGSDACISPSELTTAIERRIGRVFASPSEADLIVRGHVDRTEDGWKATVTASKPDGASLGSRELSESTSDCRALDASIELVVALMLEQEAVPAPQAVASLSGSGTTVDATAAASKPAPSSRGWDVSVALAGEGSVGVVPDPSVAMAAQVEVKPPGFVLIELSAAAWLARSATVQPGQARVSLLTAGAAACPSLWERDPVQLRGCAGIQAGEFRARGVGFGQDELAIEPAFGLTADVDLSIRFLRYAFARLSLGGWLPFIRPRFVYEDSSGNAPLVYQPPPAALIGALWLGAAF